MQKQNSIPVKKSNGTFERVLLHPDPVLSDEKLSISIFKRFFSKVKKTDDCWNWTGAKDLKGGVMGRGGAGTGTIMARKVSWLLHIGALPESRIRTTCGDTLCVNPAHFKTKDGVPAPIFNPESERWKALVAVDAIPLDHDYATQDPTLPEGFSRTFRGRFWANVDKTTSENGCWIWTASANSDGYGTIGKGWNQDGNIISTHRASWIIHNGPIPEGKQILHNCPGGDNPGCVNPVHLWLGNNRENIDDAKDKCDKRGRGHWNQSKLTVSDVLEIRTLHSKGSTIGQIRRRFKVSRCHVSKIVNGTSWKIPEAGFKPASDIEYMI